MSLNAATIQFLLSRGLTGEDLLEVARTMEIKRDPTAADRKQRQRDREKSRRDVTRDTLNDIYSKPDSPHSAKAELAPIAEKFVSDWNDGPAKRGAVPAKPLNASRMKHFAARYRESGAEGLAAAIRGIAASDWHCGRVGDWKANIGWVLKSPENFAKAMELAPQTDIPAACDTERIKALEGKISLYEQHGRETECPPLRRELATLKAKVESQAA